jgi:chromosome segregation ATPase
MTDESRLQGEIEALRLQFPDTQDLYREVCMILFFRHGITPTTNKLYQLVRKGSMSAPAEALAKFWENLRDKSRVRIEHPDIPEALRDVAGELVGQIWQRARTLADESATLARLEARRLIEVAHEAVAEADRREALAQQALASMQESESQQLERIRALEQQIAHDEGLRAGLSQQVKQLTDQQQALAQLVEAARVTEQRAAEEHKRLLLEIDRERGNVARAQKDIETLRAASDKASKHQEARLSEAHGQLAQARQNAVELEIALATIKAKRDQLQIRLQRQEAPLHKPARRRANAAVSRTANRRIAR